MQFSNMMIMISSNPVEYFTSFYPNQLPGLLDGMGAQVLHTGLQLATAIFLTGTGLGKHAGLKKKNQFSGGWTIVLRCNLATSRPKPSGYI